MYCKNVWSIIKSKFLVERQHHQGVVLFLVEKSEKYDILYA